MVSFYQAITILAIDFIICSDSMFGQLQQQMEFAMTVPEYVVTFEAAVRPLIAAIALGLIWIGATRMEGPAQSRYATAGALSVVLIAWLAVAQYLCSAKAYFATSENAVPAVLSGLLIPVMTAAVGLRLSRRAPTLVPA